MCLVSYSLLVACCPQKAAAAQRKKNAKKTKQKTFRGGLFACSCFFNCWRNIVIVAAAFPRYSSTFSVRVTIIIAVELDDREMPLLSHYRFDGRYHRGMLRWSRCFSMRFSSEFLLLRWPHVHSNILEFPSVFSAP